MTDYWNKIINIKIDKILLRHETLQKKSTVKSHHIAFLIKGKKIIETGFNEMERQYFKGKVITSLHAEIACIEKFLKKNKKYNKIKNFKLLVINIGMSDINDNDDTIIKMKDSSPCIDCTKYLLKKGFKNIYCSNKLGSIEKIDLFKYSPYTTGSRIRLEINNY